MRRKEGLCTCQDGYEGLPYERMRCSNSCSGHGTCEYIADVAKDASKAYLYYYSHGLLGCGQSARVQLRRRLRRLGLVPGVPEGRRSPDEGRGQDIAYHDAAAGPEGAERDSDLNTHTNSGVAGLTGSSLVDR